jgi:hypothetical protein
MRIFQSVPDSSSKAPTKARQRPLFVLDWLLWTALLFRTPPGIARVLLRSYTPRQSGEKLVVGELGKVCLKERGSSLLCRSSVRTCPGFEAAWASGPGGSTWLSWCWTAADSAVRNWPQSSTAQKKVTWRRLQQGNYSAKYKAINNHHQLSERPSRPSSNT